MSNGEAHCRAVDTRASGGSSCHHYGAAAFIIAEFGITYFSVVIAAIIRQSFTMGVSSAVSILKPAAWD